MLMLFVFEAEFEFESEVEEPLMALGVESVVVLALLARPQDVVVAVVGATEVADEAVGLSKASSLKL